MPVSHGALPALSAVVGRGSGKIQRGRRKKRRGGRKAARVAVKYGAVPPVSAWSCNQCDAMFASFDEMRFHEMEEHEGEREE